MLINVTDCPSIHRKPLATQILAFKCRPSALARFSQLQQSLLIVGIYQVMYSGGQLKH